VIFPEALKSRFWRLLTGTFLKVRHLRLWPWEGSICTRSHQAYQKRPAMRRQYRNGFAATPHIKADRSAPARRRRINVLYEKYTRVARKIIAQKAAPDSVTVPQNTVKYRCPHMTPNRFLYP
jgi:hypothetical protein